MVICASCKIKFWFNVPVAVCSLLGALALGACKKSSATTTNPVDTVAKGVSPPLSPPTGTTLQVIADFTRSADAGTALNHNLIGTYSPQKWVNAGKIYDRANVLDPISLPFHKVNLPNGTNIAADGTWNDITDKGQPSQKTILTQLKASGVGIHLGMETVPKVMRGNAAKVQKLFTTSMAAARAYVGTDVNIDYEILNEPELDNSVEWGYYPNFELFWSDFVNAYTALANQRLTDPKLKIGGPGFELNRWLATFISRLTNPATNTVQLSNGSTQTIDLDFISYHNYLNWDDLSIAQGNTQTAIDKMNTFYNGVNTYRVTHPNVQIYCTEYSWLKSPYSNVNDAANNRYRDCARTLELTKLASENLTLTNRFFWAQAMGQSADFGDDYFTLENFDWNSGQYKYRSGYYAFWLYQKMPVTRTYLSYDGAKLNGLASSASGKNYLVVWNRTASTQTIQLNLANINTANFNYSLYLINSASFTYGKGNSKTPPVTKSGVANAIGDIVLEKEATVYVELIPK